MAIAAGVDYDLSDGSVYRTLLWQVKQGIVPEKDLDRAVSKMLAAKFRLGLFENPYVDPDMAEKTTNSPEHRALALKAAQEVPVLLKNENNLLPLDLTKLKTIAVIGPNADGLHLGGYSRNPGHGVTILQGIQDRKRRSFLRKAAALQTRARIGMAGLKTTKNLLIRRRSRTKSSRPST